MGVAAEGEAIFAVMLVVAILDLEGVLVMRMVGLEVLK